MSTVTLTIGPRSYTVSCAPGEEAQVERLGAIVAEKYDRLGAARGPQEAQNMLFASLFMADELAEAREKAAKAEHASERSGGANEELRAEIETLRRAEAQARTEVSALKEELASLREAQRHQHDLFGGLDAGDQDRIAEMLEAIAARAEQTAERLSQGPSNGLEADAVQA